MRNPKQGPDGREFGFVAGVESYFAGQRSVVLEFGPTVPVGLIHLVGPAPIKGGALALSDGAERAGDAAEGERALGLAKEDVASVFFATEPLFGIDDSSTEPAIITETPDVLASSTWTTIG